MILYMLLAVPLIITLVISEIDSIFVHFDFFHCHLFLIIIIDVPDVSFVAKVMNV